MKRYQKIMMDGTIVISLAVALQAVVFLVSCWLIFSIKHLI